MYEEWQAGRGGNAEVKAYRALLLALVVGMFFSYYPVISLGAGEAMNFELSVPLILLVLLDIWTIVLLIRQRKMRGLVRNWRWWLFPVFASLSIIWSDNAVRGLLTMGVVWGICVAIAGMVLLKGELQEEFWRRMGWAFAGATMAICAWCVIQCILDVAGVSRDATLLCQGCTYRSFGFPHPNGLAIEPQFMGNLLILPVMAGAYLVMRKWRGVKTGLLMGFVCVSTFTLFLTFSRGAIYAMIIGVMAMVAMLLMRGQWKVMLKRAGAVFLILIGAFVMAINTQGVMAAASPTTDTYFDGVAKVINHLSLGVIEIRGDATSKEKITGVAEETQALRSEEAGEASVEETGGETMFDGYVEESTTVRQELTRQALQIWRSDLATVLVGVGIGGAGQALYNYGYYDSPKEIVQNEYASLLLEVGLIGVGLAVLTVVMVILAIKREILVVAIIIAYGVSLVFFSGVTNALQIYLMPAIVWAGMRGVKWAKN